MTCLARSWSPVMEEVSAFGVCGPAAKTARARQAARTAQAQRGEEAARRPDRRGRMGARGGRGRGAHGARLPRHPRRDDPATRLTHVGPARHKSEGRAPEDPDERVDEPLVRSRGDHRPDGEEGGDDEPDRGAGPDRAAGALSPALPTARRATRAHGLVSRLRPGSGPPLGRGALASMAMVPVGSRSAVSAPAAPASAAFRTIGRVPSTLIRCTEPCARAWPVRPSCARSSTTRTGCRRGCRWRR